MFSRILDAVFGCVHSHYSFPITLKRGKRNAAALVTGTYVVCLDCGKEMPYDWQQMKLVSADAARSPVTSLAPKEAS